MAESFQTTSGWTTVNNGTYGEVAAYNQYVFASDMVTANNSTNGIVRFGGASPTIFGQGTDFIQVALGLDGLLYGLSTNGAVQVFNPDTLAAVRSFTLTGGPDSDIRGIAVDGSGTIFAVTWTVRDIVKYKANGNFLTDLNLGTDGPDNIALDTDGQIAIGARLGTVYLTTESLSAVKTIQTNQWQVFATFDHYIGTGTGLSNLKYSTNPAVYTKGTAITPNTPSNSGGTVASYAISPALPAGLNFSTSTGIISGTPTVASVATPYTVTARNSGGSTTATVTITVLGPVSLATSVVSVAPTSIQVGNAATVTLQAKDALGSNEISGGLSLVFTLGGSPKGTLSAVSDNHNGTYSATFSGTTPGQNTITASINGQPVTSPPATVTVTAGNPVANLLLTTEVPGQSVYNLLQYTQQGTLVSSLSIPAPPQSTDVYEDARGLSVDPSGNVNIFDGTFGPYLATYSSSAHSWSFQTTTGWTTVNNISYGEVAAYNQYVFASDMVTANNSTNGIVRFGGGSPTIFGQGTDFIQVALGLDGMIYGLSTNGAVQVFNPDTLAAVRSFTLTGGPDSDIRGIAVDGSGTIYAATWGAGDLVKYDASGNFLTFVHLGADNLLNIALDTDGQIAIGGRSGAVYLTNESLTPVQTIQTNQQNVFATFDHYIGGTPPSIPLSTQSWTAVGPAPISNGQVPGSHAVSGRITGVAPDLTDANTIFVSAAGGGVWKTTDGGTTWNPLTDNLTDSSGNPIPLFMGAIAETHDSSGHEVVYAGTGEANNSADSFYGEGILVSTNGGTSWTLTGQSQFHGAAISRIAIDPKNSNIAYVAVNNFPVNSFFGPVPGIYKTTNGGTTWTNMTAAVDSTDAWSDVVIDPTTTGSSAVLFAAVGRVFAANVNGVYKSTDGGTTWTAVGGGMPSGSTLGRISLAIAHPGSASKATLYASIADASSPYGLAHLERSTDGGSTWTDISSNLNSDDYLNPQGWYDNVIEINPTNTNEVFAAGVLANQGPSFNGGGLVESQDGGATWTDGTTHPDINTGTSGNNGPHTDYHALAFDASGRLVVGNDGGIWRLDSNNISSTPNVAWTDFNGNLQTIQFTGIALDPTNANIAYGGSQDNGTEKFNGALGWSRIAAGDGGITRVDPTDPNRIYQEYTGVSLQVSNDAGSTFTDITPGIPYNRFNFYVPYVLDGSGNIYYGTDYLNYSSDHGTSWSQIGTHGVNNFNPGDFAIDAVAVNPVTNSNVVYVSANGKMFVTKNAQAGGSSVTWTEIDLPNFSAGGRNSIAVDPNDATGGTAYAVVNLFTGTGNRVFKTTNFGATWTDISGNLPDVPIWSVALYKGSSNIYIGTDTGVYYSTDGGSTWSLYKTGLPFAQVVDLEIAPQLGIMAAGTHGRGMYEIQFAGPVSTSTSPVVVAPSTITIGGTATVTLTALDQNGNQEPAGGLTVTFALTNSGAPQGTFSATTDNHNGTYTATFTSTTGIGTNDIVATITGTGTVSSQPTITVNDVAPSNLTYSTNPAVYPEGSAITPNTPSSSGGAVVSYAISPALPTGLSFSTSTGVISGTPTALSVATPYTVTATNTGGSTTAAVTITILGPVSLANSVVSVAPTSIQAGNTATVTLQAEDALGSNEISGGLSVVFALGGSPKGTLSAVSDNHNGTYTATFSGTTLGQNTITASINGQPVTSAPATVTVTAGKLVFVTPPTNPLPAGQVFSVQVAAEDLVGNIDSNFSGTAALSLTTFPPGASLGGSTSATFQNGIATFNSLSLNTPGAYVLQAAAGSLGKGNVSFNVIPLFSFNFPSSVQSNAPFTLKATATNGDGSTDTSFTGAADQLTLTLASGPGHLSGTNSATPVNGIATFANVRLDAFGLYTFMVSGGGASGTSANAIAVTANHLGFVNPLPTPVAGSAFSVHVGAEDVLNGVDTTYSGLVTISVTGPSPFNAGDVTSLTASGGLVNFSGLHLNKVGTYTLQVSANGLTGATLPLNVNPLFDFSFPASVQSNATFFIVTLTAKNGDGTIASKFMASGGQLTLGLASGPAGGHLTGTVTGTFHSGVTAFTNLRLDAAGSYFFKVSGGGVNATSASAITVTANHLVFKINSLPPSVMSGQAFGPVVLAEDVLGNVDTGFTGSINISVTGPGGFSAGDVTMLSATAGVADFTSLLHLNQAGSYTLQASGIGFASIKQAFTVTPQSFSYTMPGSVVSNTPFTVVVTALNADQTVATHVTAFGPLAIATGPGKLSLGTKIVGNGQVTFNNLKLDAAGVYTFKITGGGLTFTSPNTITVTANHLAFQVGSVPVSVMPGVNFIVTVRALSVDGTLDTNFNRTINLAANGPGALGGNVSVQASGGIATFTVFLNQPGKYTLLASSPGLASALSSAFTVK